MAFECSEHLAFEQGTRHGPSCPALWNDDAGAHDTGIGGGDIHSLNRK